MTSSHIATLIMERGCFDPHENARIYAKFFARMPRTFIRPLREYSLDSLKVLDVGCSYGMNLIHFGPGSVGFDADPRMVRFASGIGLSAVSGNAEEAFPFPDGSFDAVWCSNLLEHVRSPHDLFRRIWHVVNDSGLVFIKVPLVPRFLVSLVCRSVFGRPGYAAHEHLYAYTGETLAFLALRAGFSVLDVNVFFPSPGFLSDSLGRAFARYGVTGTLVARKDPAWRYPEKRPTC